MQEKIKERSRHLRTVISLSVGLVIVIAVTIAQDVTMSILYDKYQRLTAAYTALMTQTASLRQIPLHELNPEFLYLPDGKDGDWARALARTKTR